MRSLLITGGLGFVGKTLLRKLPRQKYESVICLTRRDTSSIEIPAAPLGVRFLQGSLSDLQRHERELSGADAVVHLAAMTGKSRKGEYFETNVQGTKKLIQILRRAQIQKFLFISSIAVRFPDKTDYYYAQSKQMAEELVRASGIRYTILRPTIILGPDAPVWKGLSRLARLPLVPIFGDGVARIQPIWVDDLADFIISLLDADRFHGETLEVGGNEAISIEEFLLKAARFLGRSKPRALHLPFRLTRSILSFLEPVLLPVLPLTAGQMASFCFDGTPQPNHLAEAGAIPSRSIEQMLYELSRHDAH